MTIWRAVALRSLQARYLRRPSGRLRSSEHTNSTLPTERYVTLDPNEVRQAKAFIIRRNAVIRHKSPICPLPEIDDPFRCEYTFSYSVMGDPWPWNRP